MNDPIGTLTSSQLQEWLPLEATVYETKWELLWSAPTAEFVLQATMPHRQEPQVALRVHEDCPMYYLVNAILIASRFTLRLTHCYTVTEPISRERRFMLLDRPVMDVLSWSEQQELCDWYTKGPTDVLYSKISKKIL